jgi:hypothetical protein
MRGQQVWGEHGIIVNELELTALKVIAGCQPDRPPLQFSRMRRRLECGDEVSRAAVSWTEGARIYGPAWAIERLYQWRRERRPETDKEWITRHRTKVALDQINERWKTE